ncbi:MAG: CinA family protein [Bacilli bacterium]|nr:CinA family protein [Bacilli bacterium]
MDNIINLLKSKKLTLSSCESITGGGFANYITNIPDASCIYKGGLVTYSNDIKMHIANIKKETIQKYGAISKECAYEMAKNTKEIFNSDICVSFTGNAGPAASESKKVGLIYIGFAYKDIVDVKEYFLKGSRSDIKNTCIKIALEKIINEIVKELS